MAPQPIARPTKAAIKQQAGKHQTQGALAAALGIGASTWSTWRQQDPELKKLADEVVNPTANGALVVPTDDVDALEVANARIKELENAQRAQRKIDVAEERILATFERAIEARSSTYNPSVIPKGKPTDQHEFVLLWSDTHAGEVVSEVETNGINAYDWKIMLERHDRIREAVFSFQDNRPYPVSKLHVCALGDMLSGDIHDELVETNEFPLAEATIQFAEDGSVFLESFLERFKHMEFSGIVGNHPRSKQKQPAKRQFDNADWLAYKAMAKFLEKEKRISFDIPKASAHPIDIVGRRCLLIHGHGIRSSMPGVPWGGVVRRVTNLDQQYAAKRMPIDHYFFGHFHQANIVQQGKIAMNGSVKGVDEYSLAAFGGGGEPQQILLTFHPKRGLTDVSFIDC